jgi:hypothetical protein
MRHLHHLWRLRITFPAADILQHCDGIDAAFRRVLYTPELAIVFAYVFSGYLLIPVGQVFGSRSAPSYFSLLSDIRAFIATCGDLTMGHPMHPLAHLNWRLFLPTSLAAIFSSLSGKCLVRAQLHPNLAYYPISELSSLHAAT